MRTISLLIFLLAFLSLIIGCSYDTSGEPADVDTSTDTDTDSDSDADAGNTGIGTECSGDGDCSDLEADYCLLNPTAPSDPGYCTLIDCDPGGCPTGYQCCDCDGIDPMDKIFCADDTSASMLASMLGCTCS